jgi:hypothetical protein
MVRPLETAKIGEGGRRLNQKDVIAAEYRREIFEQQRVRR